MIVELTDEQVNIVITSLKQSLAITKAKCIDDSKCDYIVQQSMCNECACYEKIICQLGGLSDEC